MNDERSWDKIIMALDAKWATYEDWSNKYKQLIAKRKLAVASNSKSQIDKIDEELKVHVKEPHPASPYTSSRVSNRGF